MRKYRQQGYRNTGGERREPPRPRPSFGDAPRGGPMLEKRTVSRCAACGAALPVAHSSLEQCPTCRAALHACRQCTHFDPARRFECRQPIIARIADKNAANSCDAFALTVTVERDASPDGPRPDDVRRAFGNLFKT
jgi:hypothetical protein